MLADYSEITKHAEADFARHLTIDHGVTVIPVSAFYQNPAAPESNHHLVRFVSPSRTLRWTPPSSVWPTSERARTPLAPKKNAAVRTAAFFNRPIDYD